MDPRRAVGPRRGPSRAATCAGSRNTRPGLSRGPRRGSARAPADRVEMVRLNNERLYIGMCVLLLKINGLLNSDKSKVTSPDGSLF